MSADAMVPSPRVPEGRIGRRVSIHRASMIIVHLHTTRSNIIRSPSSGERSQAPQVAGHVAALRLMTAQAVMRSCHVSNLQVGEGLSACQKRNLRGWKPRKTVSAVSQLKRGPRDGAISSLTRPCLGEQRVPFILGQDAYECTCSYSINPKGRAFAKLPTWSPGYARGPAMRILCTYEHVFAHAT